MIFRLLTGDQVAGLIDLDTLIDAMSAALKRFSAGGVVQPVRTVIEARDQHFLAVMPALLREPPAMGAKLVTVFASNAEAGLPTHLATICLFSPHTGALVALMDGTRITEWRTAAVSAASAEVLGRDETSVMAIIGSGVQARSHLLAMERIFELSQIRVWSPTPDHQYGFITEMESRTDTPLIGSDSPELAVANADLVVLATSATTPVVRNEWIKSGAHVVSVGACRPNQREMDPALVARGRLFVDSRAAAMVESGDVVMGIAEGHIKASHIAGELGEVLAEKVEGRRSPREITIFKSLGMAIEDLVAAEMVYARAVQQDVGEEIEI
jgi:ornithine cyclodeaminase